MTPSVEVLIAAGVKAAVATEWIVPVTSACSEFGIDTEKRIAAFVAQCAHESGGFTMLQENLNYRAATLAACWPNRFAELGSDKKPKRNEKGALVPTKVAHAIAGKPSLIAGMVYSNRMGNGPVESGDAAAFIGRGLKQLTGRDNYTRCGRALGVDLAQSPDLLLQPEYASRSAGWFWATNRCSEFIDKDDFVGLTKKINGGTIGLEDRQRRYKAALAIFDGAIA